MTIQAPKWYKEKIRDMVRARYQSKGGYLDNTMSRGDGGAGVIKFPVAGRVECYEISGAIQAITNTNADLDIVEVRIRDFEVNSYIRPQDLRRQGPNEQAAVAKQLANAIRRQRDLLKLDSLNNFCSIAPGTVGGPQLQDLSRPDTIGDGTTTIDILDYQFAIDQIRGAGSEEDVWAPIPEMWFSQLMMYKEFANADYVGPADLPFAKATNIRKRTWRGAHFLTLPDEHFKYGTGAWGTSTVNNKPAYTASGYIDTFVWSTEAVGAEHEWDKEEPEINKDITKEGHPWQLHSEMSGNAVGIMPEGVKRLRFKVPAKALRVA